MSNSTRLHGSAALTYAYEIGTDSVMRKYADPVEGAKESITYGEAYEVIQQDPSLIWCETVPTHPYHADAMAEVLS
jgi:hypothetical protein